jgi:hypothetical protein
VGSNQEAISRLNNGKNMMTVLSFAWVDKSPNLRALGLESKTGNGYLVPSKESILAGSYPFARPLNLVAKAPLSPEIALFFKAFESPKAGLLIEDQGFVRSSVK